MATSRSNTLLRYMRQLHLYLGVFTAPALIFFAVSGALQTFDLHVKSRESSYKPPAWAVTLAQIHKKQTAFVPVKPPKKASPEKASASTESQVKPSDPPPLATSPAAPQVKPSDPAPTPAAGSQHHPLPLKIFFLIVCIGLFASTLSGIYMSYKYMRNRVLVTGLLVLGTVLPVVLLLI